LLNLPSGGRDIFHACMRSNCRKHSSEAVFPYRPCALSCWRGGWLHIFILDLSTRERHSVLSRQSQQTRTRSHASLAHLRSTPTRRAFAPCAWGSPSVTCATCMSICNSLESLYRRVEVSCAFEGHRSPHPCSILTMTRICRMLA
jgi:hypothetical protein